MTPTQSANEHIARRDARTIRRPEMAGAPLEDRLLSADEVAELLGMSAYWVREQTRKRTIPFVALGPKVRKYRRSSLQAWLAESEERPR
jgi:excisionase family DNA binding protein